MKKKLLQQKCHFENCNNPVWSNGLCQYHTTSKPIRNKKPKNFTTGRSSKRLRKEERMKLFKTIWNKRPPYSEVSNTYLGKEPLSTYFHHILPKSKYPFAEFDEENIILLTADEHANVESDMYKYKEVNIRREMLVRKYEI